jgi:hypothetical protein
MFGEAFVILPAGLEANDLHEHPQCWQKIQATGKFRMALSQFDRVTCLAHDKSWMIEARVLAADGERVVLSKPVKFTLPTPTPQPAKPTTTETKVEQTLVRA